MEWAWNLVFWSTIILSPALLLLFCLIRPRSKRLPPGPAGWPVFGYLFNLGPMPHRTVAELKQNYGPVVWLKLASVDTMVILTANAAAELFKNHDLSFADRTITETMRSHNFHKSSISVAPYGSYWRMLRRIFAAEMFLNKRVNETAAVRQKCTADLLLWVEKEVEKNKEVGETRGIHVARLVFLASFNMIGNLVLSRDLVDPESEEGSEFFTAMNGIGEWAGSPNISDLFPFLRGLDLQGLRKKMDRDKGKALEIASGFVRQRIKETEKRKDLLDVLLEFEGSSGMDEPAKLLERDINVLILEMFMAGSETTSSTVEWALTEVLCNPETMTKVKAELAKIVGPNKKFEERDIDNMHYLQAVVKETLRLHPPLPFLVPRKAIEDANYMGYHIPKNTQVFVNVWAIGRDRECWDDPLSFKPERFLGSNIDVKGHHFELIPFGAGRRMCPGVPLAHRMVPLVLGSLLHEFDWELDSSSTSKTMDMREKIGLTMRKLEPLKAIPKRSKV